MGIRLFGLAALAFAAQPAHAIDYQTWSRSSAGFKGGYVLGLAEYYGTVALGAKTQALETAEAYRECFSGTSSDWLARQVEAYVSRNPALNEQEMVFIVHDAFRDLCKPVLDKVPAAP